MKTIANEYTLNGRKRTLVRRGRKAAIYSLSTECPCFEVVVIRKRKKPIYIYDRKICDSGDEYLPSNREWGIYGFTYTKLCDAIDKLEDIESIYIERDRLKCNM